jgi:3-dehydroquinate synthase
MEALLVPESLLINSHKGQYQAHFKNDLLRDVQPLLTNEPHFIVDENVARIYGEQLSAIVNHPNTILVQPTEEFKSLDVVSKIIQRLVANKIRRNHTIVAIGGGITQDLTCFTASTILRGVDWVFIPTTLLAQADSCIGSKSSINVGDSKNIVGTFYPPKKIWIDTSFLRTLHQDEIRSGIGEILKVHAIESSDEFDRAAISFELMLKDFDVLEQFIHSALLIKKRFIEIDEFDAGIRNIFNLGHSFGHAIEAATSFGVPHGIAVSMGMHIACSVAAARDLLRESHAERMQLVLAKNFSPYASVEIPIDSMMSALMKDKKNSSNELGLILPMGEQAEIKKIMIAPDAQFQQQLADSLSALR